MHPELKAYLDEFEAKAQARHEALLSKLITGASTPQPARPAVVASDGGHTVDATVVAVIPDAFCFTTQAQEIPTVAHAATPVCLDMVPVTCSTECPAQVIAIASVDKVHDATPTVYPEPPVDINDKEVKQLTPTRAPPTINTGISDLAPPSTRENAQEMLEPISQRFVKSQDAVASRPPRRPPELETASDQNCVREPLPRPWPSFKEIIGCDFPSNADGDGTRPLPWLSFGEVNGVVSTETASDVDGGEHGASVDDNSVHAIPCSMVPVLSITAGNHDDSTPSPTASNRCSTYCATAVSFPASPPEASIIPQAYLNLHVVCIELVGKKEQPTYITADSCEAGIYLVFLGDFDSELHEWLFHTHLETLIVTLVDWQPWPSWGFTSCASTRADAWMCSRISGTNCGATQVVPGLLNLSLVAWSRTQRLSTGSKQKPCTARENYWAMVKSEVTQWMLPSVNCLFGNGIRLLPGQQRLSEFCACSFTTAPKLQYPYLATMAAHLFHSRQKTGALSTKLSSSIFLQFMQLGPHELGCCVIFFVQSSYDICAQDIQLRVGFSQKHVQPKPPFFSGDCLTVRVWSELFKTELPYKICFSVTNLCWPATTSAPALGSVEYIGDLFLVLHEQSRKLDTTRNLVSKTQEHWNLSEHHILEHATACSIPMGDKLQRKIQLMTLSVHREIFSQGDFNRSVRFAREYNCDQPEACCSTLNQAYHKLDNSSSLSVEHPLSFTEPEPGVDACKHEQKAGDSSRVGVQLTIVVTFKCYSRFGTTMLWWQHSSSVYGTDHCNTLSALSGKNSIDDTVGTIHHMIWKSTGAELNQPVTHPGTYISLFQPKPPWPLQVVILAEFSFSGQQTNSESWHCSYCLCTILQKLSEHVHEPDGRSTVEDCNFAMHPALYHHQPFHRGTVTNWVVTMVQQHIIRTLFESSCVNDRQTSELPELDRLQITTKHLHKSVHRQFLGKEAPEGGGTCMSANQIIGGKEVIITMQSTIINCCGKGQQSTMGVVKNEEWSFYHPCHNCPAALLGLRKRADLQLCQSIGSTKLCVLSTPGTPGGFTVVMKGYCISSCKELVQGGVLAVAACFAHGSVDGCNNYYFLGISFDSVAIVHDYYSHIVRVNPDRGNHRDFELVKDHQVQWDPGGSRWRRLGVKPNFKERGMLRALLPSPTWAGPLDQLMGLARSGTTKAIRA